MATDRTRTTRSRQLQVHAGGEALASCMLATSCCCGVQQVEIEIIRVATGCKPVSNFLGSGIELIRQPCSARNQLKHRIVPDEPSIDTGQADSLRSAKRSTPSAIRRDIGCSPKSHIYHLMTITLIRSPGCVSLYVVLKV